MSSEISACPRFVLGETMGGSAEISAHAETCVVVECEKKQNCYKYKPDTATVTVDIEIRMNVNLKRQMRIETWAHELVHVDQIKTSIDAAVKNLDAPYVPDPGVPKEKLKESHKQTCEANMWGKIQPAVISAIKEHERRRQANEKEKGYWDSDHEVDARKRWPDFMPGKPGFTAPGTQGRQ